MKDAVVTGNNSLIFLFLKSYPPLASTLVARYCKISISRAAGRGKEKERKMKYQKEIVLSIFMSCP